MKEEIKNTLESDENTFVRFEPVVTLPPEIKLIHFSKEPVSKVSNTIKQEVGDKPSGFWVSDEGSNAERGWKGWCNGEEFNLSYFVYENEILLNDNANLLFIQTVNELDIFHLKYSEALRGMERWGKNAIDWRKVADDYGGILITPYLYERRFTKGMDWYYGWDCASGCIWNNKIIKDINVRRSK